MLIRLGAETYRGFKNQDQGSLGKLAAHVLMMMGGSYLKRPLSGYAQGQPLALRLSTSQKTMV
jgi:hypothetical protein